MKPWETPAGSQARTAFRNVLFLLAYGKPTTLTLRSEAEAVEWRAALRRHGVRPEEFALLTTHIQGGDQR